MREKRPTCVLVLCCVCIVLSVLAGCGKKEQPREANRAKAAGIVTLDGKPLPGGRVTFVSTRDRAFIAKTMINPDGTFVMRNSPSGDVLVAVDTEPQKYFNPDRYVPIPRKFADIKASGLKATVVEAAPDGKEKPILVELKSK